MTHLGYWDELELARILRAHGYRCLHSVEQRRITDYLPNADPNVQKRCRSYLRKNMMLPRSKRAYQIDLLAWKQNDWAAMAVEEKSQNGVPKVLRLSRQGAVLAALLPRGVREYPHSARELWLQCLGESYIGKAYFAARRIEMNVVPVGAVDYDVQVDGKRVKWAYYRGVFFVNKAEFEDFVDHWAEGPQQVVHRAPRLAYQP